MIGALTGKPMLSTGNTILLFTGGVGYKVNIPDRLRTTLKKETDVFLYIHTHVREDALDLYGFETQEDLQLYELLLTVSGIGPKTALAILNKGSEAIEHAVQKSDVDFFTSIPRLGKKNAQKIIIELKNKLGSLTDLDLSGEENEETKELIDALLSMGFLKKDILPILKKIEENDVTLEQKLRHSLQLLG